MDHYDILKGLRIERACVERDCDRNCGACDLAQDKDWLLDMYDSTISLMQRFEPLTVLNQHASDRLIDFMHGTCPACHEHVTCNKDDCSVNYCHSCGQRLKWTFES